MTSCTFGHDEVRSGDARRHWLRARSRGSILAVEEGVTVAMLEALDRRLQYGPGMRLQRSVEAAFLVAAIFTGDVRLAWVTFVLTALQVLSPRFVPVALVVVAVTRPKRGHELGDLYFDLAGSRGACTISTIVQGAGLWLIYAGKVGWGMLALAFPAASFVLAPTVGFCCGCAAYVLARDLLARSGMIARCADGACDVDVGQESAHR